MFRTARRPLPSCQGPAPRCGRYILETTMLLILVQRPFVQFSTLHIIEYHYLDYISIVLLDCFAIFLDFSESFPDAIVAALQSFLKAPSSPLIVRAKYTYVTYPLSHFFAHDNSMVRCLCEMFGVLCHSHSVRNFERARWSRLVAHIGSHAEPARWSMHSA